MQVGSRHVHILNHLLTVQHYDNCQRQVYMARYLGLQAMGALPSHPIIVTPLLPFVPSIPPFSSSPKPPL